VLIVHEATGTGSIGESIAAIIQEEAFEYLDAPSASSARSTPPSPTPHHSRKGPRERRTDRARRAVAAGVLTFPGGGIFAQAFWDPWDL